VAGSRTDSYPILDVANGAPSGTDATDELVVTWPDARDGLNHEQALVTTSTNHGRTWSKPQDATEGSDRADNPAIAISPDGSRAYLDYNAYLELLRRDGTMVLVGMPDPTLLGAASLIMKRRRLAGSVIGGIRETQEMLDFCSAHNIASDVEVIDINQINEAYERTLKSDVRYRFVIDMSTLN